MSPSLTRKWPNYNSTISVRFVLLAVVIVSELLDEIECHSLFPVTFIRILIIISGLADCCLVATIRSSVEWFVE